MEGSLFYLATVLHPRLYYKAQRMQDWIWNSPKYLDLPEGLDVAWHFKDRKSFSSYFCQPFGKQTDEVFGLTNTTMSWTSVKRGVSCAAHLSSKGNGSNMISIQTTPTEPLLNRPTTPLSSSPKLVKQTHGALQTVLFMKEVMLPHMASALKYTRLLPRLLKMYCGCLYIRE